MKKISMVLVLSIFVMLMIGCGGKYSDAIKVNEQYISLVEDYVADLDKAGNAKETAKAMNKFADGIEKVWPKMQKLAEKYPELKDKSNPPEELKVLEKRAEEAGMKMAGSMMKMMPYMNDPEVKKAQERMSKSMLGM